jgi:hypothetical protein
MAQYEEIEIDQGSDVSIEIHLVDAITLLAKNLADYNVNAKMKKSYNSDSADTIDFTTIISSPTSAGIINLSLTNTQTNALKAGRYLYDVEIDFNDSSDVTIIERVMQGRITVTPSITR